jgi:transcription elongation factor GreA
MLLNLHFIWGLYTQFLCDYLINTFFNLLLPNNAFEKKRCFTFLNTLQTLFTNMSNITYVTQTTLDAMREELNHMKGAGRQAIAAAIAEAREKGDLKENAEYDAAKEAQGMHEAKVAQLENAVANSRVIDTKDIDLSRVSILSRVKITNVATKKTVVYHIVSENEADIKQGKISVGSPIGKGLLGKEVGEIADIQVPSGTMQFKVEEITL